MLGRLPGVRSCLKRPYTQKSESLADPSEVVEERKYRRAKISNQVQIFDTSSNGQISSQGHVNHLEIFEDEDQFESRQHQPSELSAASENEEFFCPCNAQFKNWKSLARHKNKGCQVNQLVKDLDIFLTSLERNSNSNINTSTAQSGEALKQVLAKHIKHPAVSDRRSYTSTVQTDSESHLERGTAYSRGNLEISAPLFEFDEPDQEQELIQTEMAVVRNATQQQQQTDIVKRELEIVGTQIHRSISRPTLQRAFLKNKSIKFRNKKDVDFSNVVCNNAEIMFLQQQLIHKQGMIDLIVDNKDSYVKVDNKDFKLGIKHHLCQGLTVRLSNQVFLANDTNCVYRSCNQLCKLTPSAHQTLIELEEPIAVIHKRINFLMSEIKMIEDSYADRLHTANGIYIDSLKSTKKRAHKYDEKEKKILERIKKAEVVIEQKYQQMNTEFYLKLEELRQKEPKTRNRAPIAIENLELPCKDHDPSEQLLEHIAGTRDKMKQCRKLLKPSQGSLPKKLLGVSTILLDNWCGILTHYRRTMLKLFIQKACDCEYDQCKHRFHLGQRLEKSLTFRSKVVTVKWKSDFVFHRRKRTKKHTRGAQYRLVINNICSIYMASVFLQRIIILLKYPEPEHDEIRMKAKCCVISDLFYKVRNISDYVANAKTGNKKKKSLRKRGYLSMDTRPKIYERWLLHSLSDLDFIHEANAVVQTTVAESLSYESFPDVERLFKMVGVGQDPNIKAMLGAKWFPDDRLNRCAYIARRGTEIIKIEKMQYYVDVLKEIDYAKYIEYLNFEAKESTGANEEAQEEIKDESQNLVEQTKEEQFLQYNYPPIWFKGFWKQEGPIKNKSQDTEEAEDEVANHLSRRDLKEDEPQHMMDIFNVVQLPVFKSGGIINCDMRSIGHLSLYDQDETVEEQERVSMEQEQSAQEHFRNRITTQKIVTIQQTSNQNAHVQASVEPHAAPSQDIVMIDTSSTYLKKHQPLYFCYEH